MINTSVQKMLTKSTAEPGRESVTDIPGSILCVRCARKTDGLSLLKKYITFSLFLKTVPMTKEI
jgi:hypothetical protein